MSNSYFQRHDIYEIKQDRIKTVFERGVDSQNRDLTLWKDSVYSNDAPLFAMVRRFGADESRENIPVGISSHIRDENGNRYRMFNYLEEKDIQSKMSPYELLHRDLQSAMSLETQAFVADIVEQGTILDLDLGVYGSLAYEILTNNRYLDESSDIDLLVRFKKEIEVDNLRKFNDFLGRIENRVNRRVDCEFECFNGNSVNLKELFLSQFNTILVKNINEVKLQVKTEIFG